MKASFLIREGEVELRNISVPELEPDEVLIRVASVGVCGSDVHYYQHGKIGPYVVDEPMILGHELSGTIEAVGSAVSSSRIGKRVAVEPQRPCKDCEQCLSGRYNLCPRMEFYATPPIDGAFAEFVKIQSEFAFDIPDSVSFDAAALIEPLSVGIWACKRAEIGVGSRVLVAGAGPIGIIMAQTARALGAAEVIVTDISEDRRAFAMQYGATKTLDPRTDSVEGLEVDAFIDASGVAQAVYSGIKAVGPAGRVILVGMGNDDVTLPVSYIQNKEIWVSGVFRYANTWPTGIEMVASGKVNLDVLVTHKYGLGSVADALNAGKLPGAMKAIVEPGRE
jgi:L-iditol 2-dehydrogenase